MKTKVRNIMESCKYKWGSHRCCLAQGHTDLFCECKCGIRDPNASIKRDKRTT